MNQRLLVIMAALLLLVGGAGLFLYKDEKPAANEEVWVHTTLKAVGKGEAFTADNVVTTRQPATSELAGSNGIESLSGYRATEDLAEGVIINTNQTEPLPEKNVALKEGSFVYQLIVKGEDSILLVGAKPGDLVDIYLRYYTRKGSERENSIVDNKGQSITNLSVKWVKILAEKKLNSVSGLPGKEVLSRLVNDESVVGIEVESDDIIKLSEVKGLGELIALPSSKKIISDLGRRPLPGMVTELRGRSSL